MRADLRCKICARGKEGFFKVSGPPPAPPGAGGEPEIYGVSRPKLGRETPYPNGKIKSLEKCNRLCKSHTGGKRINSPAREPFLFYNV